MAKDVAPTDTMRAAFILLIVLILVVACTPTESGFTIQDAGRARADIGVALAYVTEAESFAGQLEELIDEGDAAQHVVDIQRRLDLASERLDEVLTLMGRESE